MKKKLEMDIPTKFWTEWLVADTEKRIKMMQKTMVAREVYSHLLHMVKVSHTKIDKKFLAYTAAREVNDLCQDLENVMRERNS